MTNLLNIPIKTDKHRGILSIYILHSLKKKPKSGYELLAEIKEKTEGTWIPSKGTIYPLLQHLEKEGLIKIKSVEKRSKNIFEVTVEGKKSLISIKKHGKQMEKTFVQFRNLMSEIISPKESDLEKLIFEIRLNSMSNAKGKKDDVIIILKNCLNNLKKINMIDPKEV